MFCLLKTEVGCLPELGGPCACCVSVLKSNVLQPVVGRTLEAGGMMLTWILVSCAGLGCAGNKIPPLLIPCLLG